jgi:hypothetical protein
MSADKLENVLKNTQNFFSQNLHTAVPGVVVSFDAATQLAQIQVGIKTLLIDNNEIEIPPLINVPMTFIRGGGFSQTLPIAAGDECLITFCEKSIDRWKKDGSGFSPEHARKHSLSDAVASVTLSSQKNVIPNFDAANLQIKKDDGTVSITLNSDSSFKIISNNATIEINPNSDIILKNDGGEISLKNDKTVTIDNSLGNVSIDPSGNVSLGNGSALASSGSVMSLFANGKIDISSRSEGESLFDILKSTLNTLAVTTVTHNGTRPIDQQSDFAALAARINKFIP